MFLNFRGKSFWVSGEKVFWVSREKSFRIPRLEDKALIIIIAVVKAVVVAVAVIVAVVFPHVLPSTPSNHTKLNKEEHHERQGHTKTPQIKSELNPTERHHQNADTNAKSKKQRNPPTHGGHNVWLLFEFPPRPPGETKHRKYRYTLILFCHDFLPKMSNNGRIMSYPSRRWASPGGCGRIAKHTFLYVLVGYSRFAPDGGSACCCDFFHLQSLPYTHFLFSTFFGPFQCNSKKSKKSSARMFHGR